MSINIKDGSGEAYLAKIDVHNRLHTGTVSRTERDAAIADGRLFIMSTNVITLTDDVRTPCIFLQNDDKRPMYLDLFVSTTGPSDAATGSVKMTSWINVSPTSTIVSNAVPANVGNANTTSAKIYNGLAYQGVTGDTIVGGANLVTWIRPQESTIETPMLAVLAKGANGIFAFQAPAGNTSMEVTILLTVYYLDDHLPD
jgi:hypothetical protein